MILFHILISLLQSNSGRRPPQVWSILPGLPLLLSSAHRLPCAGRRSSWLEGVLHYVCRDVISTQELVFSLKERNNRQTPISVINFFCIIFKFKKLHHVQLHNYWIAHWFVNLVKFVINYIFHYNGEINHGD